MQHDVAPEDAGKRADLVIAHLTGFPRSLVAEAVKRGDVRVNGVAVKGSYLLSEGESIAFELVERPAIAVEAEAIDLTIVYEDDDVLVVDKPAGMVSHPAHGATSGTLVNALLGYVRELPGEKLRPGLVHRLDRDTSGLLVVAKNDASLSALGKAMKARRITREYLGLVVGVPPHPKGTLDGKIGRDPKNRLKYTITAEGKPSVTHYEMRTPLYNASELLFRLETGRTHQIRVHMAALGFPIVNDPVYGKTDPRLPLAGQALHAWKLAFTHPRTGQELTFEIDPPTEYTATRTMLSTRPSTSSG
ncbi:MAG: RluA family pseudouridine synthase [Candidatus Eremiobacteraeota bacterium]|nr:RluA family pseudouridine synthase [Candidatus Eremiobacteraeota bacterium]